MKDHTGQILYIGKALDLAKRVSSYFLDRLDRGPKIQALVQSINHIDYIPADSEREALIIEQGLIRELQPNFNTMWRDDKSFPFIKLTWAEDFPRLYLTRRTPKDGSKYFGPYPNVYSIRHLLRSLWRSKFFPLRLCRYEFSEAKPLPLVKAKQCLYYHTRECPAPCVGRISKTDYRQLAKEAELFFRGRYRPLLSEWEKDMKAASANQDYERAAKLRDNLAGLQHLEERVTVRQINVSDALNRVDHSRAITELQKTLGLKKPPLRVECFDISHFQGLETVASLVVFERGLPKKSDYRKFKIKTVQGIDDFASMGEVVGRRYRRLLNEGRPLPDLILIDGGKGQLGAAQQALYAAFASQGSSVKPSKNPDGLSAVPESTDRAPVPALTAGTRGKIPMASLAKREEELFVPDRSESIRLSKDSPALHLVQHIRDEAHRFAITFHRQRRAKRFLPH